MTPKEIINTNSKANLLNEAKKIEKRYQMNIVGIYYDEIPNSDCNFFLITAKVNDNTKLRNLKIWQIDWKLRQINFTVKTKRKLKITPKETLSTKIY